MRIKWLFLYGLFLTSGLGSQAALLFPTNSTWKYFVGVTEASTPDTTAWRAVGFNDAGWASGRAPIGYGELDIVTALPTSQSANYTSVYFRKFFTISNLAEVSRLDLTARVDDGLVVWINSVEVGRINAPTTGLAYNAVAPSAGEPTPFSVMISQNLNTLLVEGSNVVAIQLFNSGLTSSDLLLDASLSAAQPDPIPPAIAGVTPPPGNVPSLSAVTVTFTEPVAGVDAGDLLINGFPASNLSGGPEAYTFTFIEPPYGVASFEWKPGHGIIDFAFPPNSFIATGPGATWQYLVVDDVPPVVSALAPPAGLTVRRLGQVDVQFNENVVGVDAADLLVNGQAATNLMIFPGNLFTFQFAEPATGLVQVEWATGHGITDQAAQPNPFAGGSWSYNLDPTAPPPDLVLNEIMASNQSGLTDEQGEQSDWIEIWNRGSTSVNLQGWSLSDDPNLPGQWVFPSYVLQPNAYLVVFASGKNIKQPTGANKFHTNFKLGIAGEHLGLYTTDAPRQPSAGLFGVFPEQRNDKSYGLDSAGNLRYFASPTPGAPNGDSSLVGVVQPVHFSVPRGFFTNSFVLHLTTETPGANIRFTTDGSEPTESKGALYGLPLTLDKTTLLRAAAFRPDSLPSLVGTHTYLFNLSTALVSLPIVSIVTDSNHLYGRTGIMGMNGGTGPPNDEWLPTNPADTNQYHNPKSSLTNGPAWERPTSIEFIRQDNSGFQIDCGIRVHGSGWTRPRYTKDDKFAFRLYFKGDYGPTRLEYPWFPESANNQLDEVVLRAGHNDIRNPFIVDSLMRWLSADMGQVASHGTFANLLVNGIPMTFRGEAGNFYYNPVDRIKEGFLQAWHGGSLDWDIISPFGENPPPGGDRVAWNALETFIRGQDFSQQANYQNVLQRLDLVNFVDYLLVNVYGATWDWPHNNWRAARERTPQGIWRFYVWDAEGAFYVAGRTVTYNNFTDTSQGLADTEEIATFYQKLRANPEFRLLFADRIQKHFFNGGALTESNVTRRFNAMRTELAGVLPGMELRILNDWIPNRRSPLFTQFQQQGLLAATPAPTFSRHGGRVARGFQVTLTNTSGTLYYTTNGEDPRLPFTGTVAPTAIACVPGTPLTINQSLILKARALAGGNWSALTETTFTVGFLGLPLRITEIMYHPPGGNSALEYIELQNVGLLPLDISGVSFEGLTFTVPTPSILAPGQIIVLASDNDPLAFAARYPGVVPAGAFSGSLANGGEKITLRDKDGQVIQSVDYRDGGGWPAQADGNGYSLEILDPLGPPDEPANWQASLALSGSPGQPPQPSAPPIVRLNEVMADNLSTLNNAGSLPDWIELHNTNPADVQLAGWSLTDDGDPRKFVFPPNTVIPAGDYLLVYCDAVTNVTPGFHAGFALDNDGESIFLYDAQTNRVDALTFGLQLPDLSVGRIGQAWTLNEPTPNAPNNAAPMADPSQITLNEWMANPPPGGDDWIELHNKSAVRPAPLQGLYLQAGQALHLITSLSFIAPTSYVQLRADENVGSDHLDFRLPAAGATLVLYDPAAVELERITYGAMAENSSQGRLPNGSATLVSFLTSPSPGAPNYQVTATGPVLNELMARNASAVTNARGRTADWLELHNPAATTVDLMGMSLSIDQIQPRQWVFPPDVTIAPGGYLVVWCDGDQPPSIIAEPVLNTGQSLDGQSGGAYLFNAAGQLISAIEYGSQIENQSIGRSAAKWVLLSNPTPAATNSAPALLGSASSLRLNEWMANPIEEDDWFEIFNPSTLPVTLGGLYLADDPSLAGATNFQVAPLSFVGPAGWVRWEASGNPSRGRQHASFKLDTLGETLRIYDTNRTLIDSVSFGKQERGVSEGRLPDGADNIVTFETTATPERSNYLPLPIVINEALTHTDPPLEDAVELYNTSASSIPISGWYLSDSRQNLKKFRIPDGTTIPGHGFVVFYQYQFDDGSPNAFALNSAHGGTLWLSQAGPGGLLTGYRAGIEFGPAENGVSFGRLVTPFGEDFVASTQRSFGTDNPATLAQFRTGTGQTNADPKVGPVVINEIMYHPPDQLVDGIPVDNARDEFVELHNLSAQSVQLQHPLFPSNTWRLSGGIEFSFPTGTTLPAGGFLLVVNFDPLADPLSLDAFRTQYNLSPQVPILGPFRGRLSNDRDAVQLLEPDAPQQPPSPDAGFIPFPLADQVAYQDALPWPAGDADGHGLSLQKPNAAAYGNNPLHWVADQPTPGAANGSGILPPPIISTSPTDQASPPGRRLILAVQTTGSGPFSYQWRRNGRAIPGATNAALVISYLSLPDEGAYDVLVGNPGGSTLSQTAHLTVTAPPVIAQGPLSQSVRAGTNVTLTVGAFGPGPLLYQWFLNGRPVADATSPVLFLPNVGLAQSGEYEIRVTNPHATVSAFATLEVLVNPSVLIPPQSQTVVQGEDVTLSILVTGTLPMSYRWRRSSTTLKNETLQSGQSFLTIPNIQTNQGGDRNLYSVVLTNKAFYAPGVLSAAANITVLPDADGDRLPDAYETTYQLNPQDPADGPVDSDGDGLTNREEYIAGTDPRNPASYLRVESLHADGQGVVLRFMARAAKTYTVQFKDILGNTPWQTLQNVPGQPLTQEISIADPDASGLTGRLYRLVTPKQGL